MDGAIPCNVMPKCVTPNRWQGSSRFAAPTKGVFGDALVCDSR